MCNTTEWGLGYEAPICLRQTFPNMLIFLRHNLSVASVRLWAEEEIRLEHLLPKSGGILDVVICRGELPRADAANIVGTGERQTRRVVSALLEIGILTSESTRAATPCLPSDTCRAVDALSVPGKDVRRPTPEGMRLTSALACQAPCQRSRNHRFSCIAPSV